MDDKGKYYDDVVFRVDSDLQIKRDYELIKKLIEFWYKEFYTLYGSVDDEEFRKSMIWGISDKICGGTEPEWNEDEVFAFLKED